MCRGENSQRPLLFPNNCLSITNFRKNEKLCKTSSDLKKREGSGLTGVNTPLSQCANCWFSYFVCVNACLRKNTPKRRPQWTLFSLLLSLMWTHVKPAAKGMTTTYIFNLYRATQYCVTVLWNRQEWDMYDIQNTSFVPLGHNFLRLKETSETLLSVPSKVRWEITVRIRMNEIRWWW